VDQGDVVPAHQAGLVISVKVFSVERDDGGLVVVSDFVDGEASDKRDPGLVEAPCDALAVPNEVTLLANILCVEDEFDFANVAAAEFSG
jgi:hypothetical protein